MKKRIIPLLLICGTFLSGCSAGDLEIKQPNQASTAIESYKDAIEEEAYKITGSVALDPGDYVVYSNAGTSCVIDNGEIGQEFTEREFFSVQEESVNVTITDGYVLPLDKATAVNGEIETSGVFLVGFDILPISDKVGTNSMVVVSESIPVLFEQAAKTKYAKYSEFEAVEGMVIKFEDTYLVTRPEWNIEERVANFYSSYVNTAIDNGYIITDAEVDENKLLLLYLYSLKAYAAEYSCDLVHLTFTGSAEFTYKGTTYKLSGNDFYIITKNTEDILVDTDTATKQVQPMSEVFESGTDDIGIHGTQSTQISIIGDVYSKEFYADMNDVADVSTFTYVRGEESEVTSSNTEDLLDGDCIISKSDTVVGFTDYKGMASTVQAVNQQAHVGVEYTYPAGTSFPDKDLPYGVYQVVSGVYSTEFASGTEDYILIDESFGVADVDEDVTLKGVAFDDYIDITKSKLDSNSAETTESTTIVDERKYKKTYTITPDMGELTVGRELSANMYTLASPSTVYVKRVSSPRVKTYNDVRTLILCDGDIIYVDENITMSAYVTDAMVEKEKRAMAEAKGLVYKEYTINSSCVFDKNFPAQEYEVVSECTAALWRGDTKVCDVSMGNTITTLAGDEIRVSEGPCVLGAYEASDVVVGEGKYTVFNKMVTVGAEIDVSTYNVTAGSLVYTTDGGEEKTVYVGEQVDLTEGLTIKEGWYVIEKVTEQGTEGLE